MSVHGGVHGGVCVCVCHHEREKERKREREKENDPCGGDGLGLEAKQGSIPHG